MQRVLGGRYFKFLWGSCLILMRLVNGLWWNLTESKERSSLSLLQHKPKCFLLWMFGSNQSLPSTLSLQMLLYLYWTLAATSHLLPKPLFLPCYPSMWLPIHVTKMFVDLFCVNFFFLKEIHYSMLWRFDFLFFYHSFNCFMLCRPTSIYPQAVTPTPALIPYPGYVLVMACSEHCGVLRTAWSNVDKAWGGTIGGLHPETSSDVSQVHNGSVLLTCEYYSTRFISCL